MTSGKRMNEFAVTLHSPILSEDKNANLEYIYSSLVPPKPVRGTWFIFAVILLMFAWSLAANHWQVESPKVNPMLGPSVFTLDKLGAKNVERILEQGEWWRLIAANFLHGGFVHLILNLWVFHNLAKGFELEYGSIKLLAVFMLSGISGFLLSANFLPGNLSVGASGSIFGLVGAMYADIYHNYHFTPDARIHLRKINLSVAFMLIFGLLPIIDNFVHIGGLLGGIFTGFAILGHKEVYNFKSSARSEKRRFYMNIAAWILVASWFALQFGLLYGKVNVAEECKFCSYMNCVPTPWWSCQMNTCQLHYTNGSIIAAPLSTCGL